MSLIATSQPSKAPSPPPSAASRRREAGATGFDTLLRGGDAADATGANLGAAALTSRAPNAKATKTTPQVPAAPATDDQKDGLRTGDDVRAVTGPTLPLVAPLPPSPPIASSPPVLGAGAASVTATPGSASTVPAASLLGAAPSAKLSAALAPVREGGPDDDEGGAEAGKEAVTDASGGVARTGGSASNAVGAPPSVSPDGSPAQPLLNALAGTGATHVTAQVVSSPVVSRLSAGSTGRLKSAATLAAPDGKAAVGATDRTPAAEPPDPAAPVALVAAARDDGDAGDDTPGGDTGDAQTGPTLDAGQSGAGTAGFAPTLADTPTTPQAGAQAAPLSASAADLAAQMAARVSTGSSQFKLQLNPLGLGQVDVTVSIGANRQLTAALAFADPQTASALSAHAGELRSVLEQAGFSVPANGFDFSAVNAPHPVVQQTALNLQSGLGGGSGQSGGGWTPSTPFNVGDLPLSSTAADTAAWSGGGDSRLDIRI